MRPSARAAHTAAPLTAFDEPEELNFFYSTHLDLIHKTVCHIYS